MAHYEDLAAPMMANLLLLMAMLIGIFALIGMQFFGGGFNPSTGFSLDACPAGEGCTDPYLREKPRLHFDYFLPASLTTFTIMTEDWSAAMLPVLRVNYGAGIAFFVVATLIGRYVLLNLLVAVVLHAFAVTRATASDDAPAARRLSTSEAIASVYARRNSVNTLDTEDEEADFGPIWPRDFSLLVFAPKDPIRLAAKWLVAQPLFNQIILLTVFISSICLAIDSPRNDPASELSVRIQQANLFCIGVFSIEALAKMISLGLVWGSDTYLASPWNQVCCRV